MARYDLCQSAKKSRQWQVALVVRQVQVGMVLSVADAAERPVHELLLTAPSEPITLTRRRPPFGRKHHLSSFVRTAALSAELPFPERKLLETP